MSYDISIERKRCLERLCVESRILIKTDIREKIDKTLNPRSIETTAINREVIESSAKKASIELWTYILKHVVYEVPFSKLKAPCTRRVFENRVKKFYWLLDKELYFKKEKKLWKNESY